LIHCILVLPPLSSTLFPYTTLFRSRRQNSSIIHRVCVNLTPAPQTSPPPSEFSPRRPPASIHTIRAARVLALLPPLHTSDENPRSEEHTSELQSRENLVCRLLLDKK